MRRTASFVLGFAFAVLAAPALPSRAALPPGVDDAAIEAAALASFPDA
jgi:hypothetical protein